VQKECFLLTDYGRWVGGADGACAMVNQPVGRTVDAHSLFAVPGRLICHPIPSKVAILIPLAAATAILAVIREEICFRDGISKLLDLELDLIELRARHLSDARAAVKHLERGQCHDLFVDGGVGCGAVEWGGGEVRG
jgi:hypothetical protein